MNTNQINISIAESLGWHAHSELDNVLCAPHQSSTPLVADLIPMPHYASDLNACAEFEKAMGYKLQSIYADHLAVIVGIYDDYYEGITFSEAQKLIYATAEQRCEAYLKTLKKWRAGE